MSNTFFIPDRVTDLADGADYYTKSQVDSLLAAAPDGTVTSVGVSVPGGMSVSGSPVSSSGTIALGLTVTGVLKGSGGAFAQAVAGTDYSAPGHTHDDRYYTEAEVDALLLGVGGGSGPAGATGSLQINGGSGSFAALWSYASNTLSVASGDRISFAGASGEYLRIGSTRYLHGGADTFSTSVYLGPGAGRVTSTALESVAVGASALANEESHGANVAVGAFALEQGTDVSSSVAIGRGALNLLGTAGASSNVIGVGYNSMAALTAGSNVIGIGTVFGAAATITASQGIGAGVANSATAVTSTTAIGRNVLAAASAPDSCVAIGDFAMTAAGATAYGTVAIGPQAGSVPTSLSQCTFLGGYAGGYSPAPATLSKSIGLGWNAQPTANNTCAIGGTGSDAVAVVVNGNSTTSQLQVNATAGDKPIASFRSGSTPSGNQFQILDYGEVPQIYATFGYQLASRAGFKVATTSGYYEGYNANNYMFWGGGSPNCQVTPVNGGHIGFCVKANGSQSVPIVEFLDASNAIGFLLTKTAYPALAKNAAPADADLAANQAAFWFDSTAGACQLMVKGKDSAGTVVALAIPF